MFLDGIIVGVIFDKKFMYECVVVIGKEVCGKGVNIWLVLVVGLMGCKFKGGCNWEGFGVDFVF